MRCSLIIEWHLSFFLYYFVPRQAGVPRSSIPGYDRHHRKRLNKEHPLRNFKKKFHIIKLPVGILGRLHFVLRFQIGNLLPTWHVRTQGWSCFKSIDLNLRRPHRPSNAMQPWRGIAIDTNYYILGWRGAVLASRQFRQTIGRLNVEFIQRYSVRHNVPTAMCAVYETIAAVPADVLVCYFCLGGIVLESDLVPYGQPFFLVYARISRDI